MPCPVRACDGRRAFGTLATVAIVAATAIAALIQLRHLRAGNQINSMLSIGENFNGRAFRDAMYLISRQLERALEDPAFRNYEIALSTAQAPWPVPPMPATA